jgi:hypothetical protein
VGEIIIRLELQLNIQQSENENVRVTRPPPPEQGGVIPPTPVVLTQLQTPMFQSQPGTPGLGNRGTPAGAQGNQGNAAPIAGGGGNNGVLSAMDVATSER